MSAPYVPPMQKVRLIGGPLDGEHRHVKRGRTAVTFEWEEENVEADWDGVTVYVTRVGVATYARVDERTFRHVVTPTKIGDPVDQLPGLSFHEEPA